MFSLADASLYVADLDLWIDSGRTRDRCYVSHGHSDHARMHGTVITSTNNARVCQQRFGRRAEPGANAAVTFEEHDFNVPWEVGGHRITLFSAGHVLGSAQILIEGERGRFVYTGDFKLDPSYTAEAPEVKRCDEVLMECTYGRPQYVFPPRAEIAGEMVAFARKALEDGATPIFFAYSLGKAQEAMAILGAGGIPLVAHGAVYAMSQVYERAGVALPPYEKYDAEAFEGAKALIWPPSGGALPKAVRGRPVRTASLTGWVMTGRFGRGGTDAGFPLSDHADYPSLLRYVELAQPRKVWLTHGYKDFVYALRRAGVDAEYLVANAQLTLF